MRKNGQKEHNLIHSITPALGNFSRKLLSGRLVAFITLVILGGFISLSIHVEMLTLGVPFPASAPPLWAKWLNSAIFIGALIAVWWLATPRFTSLRLVHRYFILVLIQVTLRETFRKAIMNGVVTGAWAFSALSLLEPLIEAALAAALVLLVARWVRSPLRLLAAALLLGAVFIVSQTELSALFGHLQDHFSYLSRPDAYKFPYPLAVNIPAYITFCEPVFGAAVLTALVWDGLPRSPTLALGLLALWVAALRGILGAALLYIFFAKAPPPLAALSYSQFLLEFLVLGLWTGVAWSLLLAPARSRPGTRG